MQTEQQRYSHHHHPCHPCGSDKESQTGGPEMFYGYCHRSGRMRMMNYSDYMSNIQTGMSNLMSSPAAAMQPLIDSMTRMLGGQSGGTATGTMQGRDYSYRDQDWGHKHHGCGCHEHHHDCGCECCIRCADLVEYARCGEVRQIPVTFENDTRRERNVTLELGSFVTDSGQNVGWQASLSETQFTLGPCGHKTVILTVPVECGSLVANQGGSTPNQPPGTTPGAPSQQQTPGVDSCKVAYATLRADGCTVRPLVVAVAVLPSRCGAHSVPCGCGCC